MVEVGPIIQLMPPENNTLQILSNEVQPTANWSLGFNRPLNESEYFEFLSPEPRHVVWNKQRDSLTAFYETTKNSGSFSGVLHIAELSDTVSKKYFFKEESKLEIKTNLVNKQLRANDTLKLISNEPFQAIDTSLLLFSGIETGDSVKRRISYSLDSISPLKIGLYFDRSNQEKLFLNIPPSAVKGLNYELIDSLNLDFTLQKVKETGIMIIEFDTIPAYGILYITNKKSQKITEVVFDGVEKVSHQIEFLEPGQYGFHYLLDEDRNGQWTTGSIFNTVDAEEIIWFSEPSTIRANWEVKSILPMKKVKVDEKPVNVK
jgi:hypothetical protein